MTNLASIRWRLTVAITLLTAVVASVAVLLGSSRLETALVDDLFEDELRDLTVILEGGPDDADGFVMLGGETANPGTFITQSIEVFGGFLPDPLLSSEVDEAAIVLQDLIDDGDADALYEALGREPGSPVAVISTFGAVALVEPSTPTEPVPRTTLVVADAAVEGPLVPILELYELGLPGFGRLGGFDDAFPFDFGFDVDDGENREFRVRTVGPVDVVATASLDDVLREMSTIRKVLWGATVVLTALAGLATWFLTGRALRPVGRITDQVGEISSRNLHERVPVPGTKDEIGQLAITMNSMLDRLEASDRQRRRFVSDAAHELRSPIAVIRSEAEVALNHPEQLDKTELAETIVNESDRLGGLVEDLLVLARGDEGRPLEVSTVVDLDDLVLEEAARTRRLPCDRRAVSAAQVRGRAEDLTRVVAHLLDNGARHGQSRLAIGLQQADGTATLWVDDDGAGIPVEHRATVFERFTRLEEARSRDTGGAGLGLAVVATTVAGLGGAVTVEDSPLGGARFVVRLPSAVAPGD